MSILTLFTTDHHKLHRGTTQEVCLYTSHCNSISQPDQSINRPGPQGRYCIEWSGVNKTYQKLLKGNCKAKGPYPVNTNLSKAISKNQLLEVKEFGNVFSKTLSTHLLRRFRKWWNVYKMAEHLRKDKQYWNCIECVVARYKELYTALQIIVLSGWQIIYWVCTRKL